MLSFGTLRATGKRILLTTPLYRLLPPGELRNAAALLYQRDAVTPEELARSFAATRTIPTRFPVAARVAARVAAQAAFQAGRDDLVEEILTSIAHRFPHIADIPLVQADMRTAYGDYDGALARANEARLLEPDRPDVVAKVVWLHHLTGAADADQVAVEASRSFPHSGLVLWAVARGCRTAEQFERFAGAWRETVREPHELVAGVRPLAAAATRAGLLDSAVEVYAEGILLWLSGYRSPVTTSPELASKRPAAAVADICAALDAAGIPFFFAAGTALGLIREGRPIGHDVDIDIGVFAHDWDREALAEAFRKHPQFMPNVAHPRNEKVAAKHRGGASIDVFRFYEEGGSVWHAGTFTRWRNSPFGVHRRMIGGVEVPLPDDEERYLVENYGEGWRTPDAGFDAFTDAPNVQVTWPEYYDFYRVRRAYLRFASGDVRAALRDIDRTAPMLARTESGRQVLAVLGHAPAAAPAGTAPRFDARAALGPIARGYVPIEPEVVVEAARHARATGDRARAVGLVERALRADGWRSPLLWHERLTLMADRSDYVAIRNLFWASPSACHTGVAALRTVARAACLAGEHDEARALLRKAILSEARKRSTWRRIRAQGTASRRPALPPFEERSGPALADLQRVLDDQSARCFLVAGTFLGLVREGGVIAWDKDIDVGVFRHEADMAALEAALARHEAFSVRRLDLTTDRLRVTHESRVHIDIFPHYEEAGRVWHDGAATRWWNTPFDLEEVTFLGTRRLAPADADRYLTESYGDWRRPDPHFDARLDAPNVEITDADYFHSLQFFDLLRAVRKGDERRKQRHIALLREFGEGAWLDRL